MSVRPMLSSISLKPYWGPIIWSRKLFDSIFKVTEDAPANDPVVRINIKHATLWTRVLDQSNDESEAKSIENSFLNECVLECPQKSADWFQRKMLEGAKSAQTGDPRDNFWLLTISLLAATADEESLGQNDYRTRLAEILEVQNERETRFGLQSLPIMWEALRAKTLEMAMSSSGCYRILELPDPGNEVRIGYSKKLTFPAQKDLKKFVEVIATTSGLESDPIPASLCRALENPKRGQFSKSFRDAISKFRNNLYSDDLYKDPVWVTYIEILRMEYRYVAPGLAGESAGSLVSNIDLVMYPNYEVEFAILSRQAAEELAPISPCGDFAWQAEGGDYRSQLTREESSEVNWFVGVFDFKDHPSYLNSSTQWPKQLKTCWDDGVFVFQKSEEGNWIARRNCSESHGIVYLLMFDIFAKKLRNRVGSEEFLTVILDAPQVPNNFTMMKVNVSSLAEHLRREIGTPKPGGHISNAPILPKELNWFLWNTAQPRLRFQALLKQEQSCFVSRAIPLQIHKDDWKKCVVIAMDIGDPSAHGELPTEEDCFIFRPGENDTLEDGQKLRIRVEGANQVMQRDIIVTTKCYVPAVFKTPSDPSRKQVEKAQGQLGPVDSEDRCRSVTENPVIPEDMIPSFSPMGSSGDRHAKECLSQWRTLDHYQGVYAELLESLAVAATCRKTLRYSDLKTWIDNVYPNCRYEIFASLQDNGFMQEWYPTNHYMPVYWVPSPYLVRIDDNVVRVIGIVPKNERVQLLQLCEQRSVEPLVAQIEESGVLGAIELKGITLEFLENLRNKFGWEVSSVEDQPLSSPEEVLSVSLKGRHEDANAENRLIWKWGKSKFVEIPDRKDVPQISLQKYKDQNRPNRYVIFDSETMRWATRSQNWAILMLATLEQKQLYNLSVSGDLCRNTDRHAFGRSLPGPVGRYALSNGAGVSGPIHSDKGNTYVHCFGDVTRALDCCGEWVASGDLESKPEVSLSIDPLSGEYPLEIYCSGQASGVVKGWSWNFGDGSSSTDQNPTHTYTSAGEYVIRLTVVCRGGEGRAQREIRVEEPVPQACFDMDPITGPYPLTVQFSDTATGRIETRNWDFGDGESSTEKDPSHHYEVPGSYIIALAVKGPGGSSQFENLLVVKEHPPEVHFHASPLKGVAPLEVKFKHKSFGKVDSYKWDFGDGCDSNQADPIHQYANPGAFKAKLSVSGPGGSHSYIHPSYINVAEFAKAPNVVISPIEGTAPLTVTLSHDFSEPIMEVQWAFGDGAWVEYEAESHQYKKPGEYSGKLTLISKALRGEIYEFPFKVVVHKSDLALDGRNNNIAPNKQNPRRRTRRPLRKVVIEMVPQFIEWILAVITGRKKHDR